MSGQEALEYGIVDKVITKREMVNMGKNNKKRISVLLLDEIPV
jgi:ATP-dependent protease ClpP protease subunit